jgi:hypothetical protein
MLTGDKNRFATLFMLIAISFSSFASDVERHWQVGLWSGVVETEFVQST